MENIIKASGSTGSNMAMENYSMPKARARKGSGTMANYNNGYQKNEEMDYTANNLAIYQKDPKHLHRAIITKY